MLEELGSCLREYYKRLESETAKQVVPRVRHVHTISHNLVKVHAQPIGLTL